MADKTIPAFKILRGNVGINTATPAFKIDVDGSAVFRGAASWAGNDNQNASIYLSTAGYGLHGNFANYARNLVRANSQYVEVGQNSTLVYGVKFIVGSAAPNGFMFQSNVSGSMTTHMSIRGDTGNVGIGTAGPSAGLEVYGSGHDNASLKITNAGSSNARLLLNSGHGNWSVCNSDTVGDALEFRDESAAATRMIIISSGSVGIGTANPQALFQCYSSAIIGHADQQTTQLTIEALNTAGSPAATTKILMKGYEGRGIGTFYTDSSYSGQEWFCGMNYAAAFGYWNVGYDASGGQAEYNANTLFRVKYTGRVEMLNYGSGTFTGTPAYKLSVDSSGNIIETAIGAGAVDGAGSANFLSLWSDSDTLTNSIISQSGTAYAQINGGVRITGDHTDSGSQLNIWCDNSGHARAAAYDYFFYTGGNNSRSNVALFLKSDGNVGIGETDPDKPLHIRGTNTAGIVIENTTNATNMDIDWYNNVGSVSGRIRYSEGTGDFSFMPNQSTNAVVFKYGGFVGIGTGSTMSSSNEKLGVYSASAGHSSFKNASDSTGTVYIRNVSTTANTWQPYLILADSGGNRGGLGLQYSTAGLKVHGQGGIEFWTGSSFGGGTVKMTIASGGTVSVGGNFTIPQGNLLYLDGGSNTYIYSDTADSIAIATGGSVRMTLNNSQVSINKEAKFPNNVGVFFSNAGGSSTLGLKADTSDRLTFRTGGAWDQMVLDDNGNLGIGYNPTGARLEVQKSSGNIFKCRGDSNTTRLEVGASGACTIEANTGNYPLKITNADSGDKGLHVSSCSAMIGRTNVATSYSATDYDLFLGNGNNDGTTLLLYNYAGNYHSALVRYYNNTLKLGLNNSNSADSIFGTTAISVTNTGVGIGVAAPTSLFHVTGDSANSAFLAYIYNSGTQSEDNGLNVQVASSGTSCYGLRVNTGGNSNTLVATGSGNVGIGYTPSNITEKFCVNGKTKLQSAGDGNNVLECVDSAGDAMFNIRQSSNDCLIRAYRDGGTQTIQLHSDGESYLMTAAGGGTDLQIGGSAVTSHGTVVMANGTGASIAKIRVEGSDDSFYLSKIAGSGKFYITSDGEPIVLTGGSVGIGTNAPSAPLEVYYAGSSSVPGIIVRNTTNATTSSILFEDDGGNRKWACGYNDATNDWRVSQSSGSSSGNLEYPKLVVANGGNVGIGIVIPANKLQVKHAADISPTSGAAGQFAVQGNGYTTFLAMDGTAAYFGHNSSGRHLRFMTNETTRLAIDGSGTYIHSYTHFLPVSNGSYTSGGSSNRWSNTYSVLGNFSSDVTISGNVGINGFSPSSSYGLQVGGNAQVAGSFSASSKSFLIDHPTKENKKLEHGCLEGPEFGVYYRGRAQSNTITLPDYWTGLVRGDSITVQLTPKGSFQHLYVVSQSLTEVVIGAADGETIDCFYTIYGERADIDRLEVEKEV
jgi:hypothetical protein